MPRSLNIPCDEIPENEVKLKSLGFQVLGSGPAPSVPGFCTLRFQYPAPAAAPAPAPAPGPVVATAMLRAPAPTPAATPHGPLDPLQRRAAEAIVNIFETGDVRGKYGQVTVLDGDPGHLTFGRSQTTLSTGNLGKLIDAYCRTAGARFGARLTPYLPKLKDKLTELDDDRRLHNLLRASADDPVMRDVQDRFFDQAYWQPAIAQAAEMQISTALGIAVVYDSIVHGSWGKIRDRTVHQYGAIGAALPEQDWIKAYIKTRGEWLANSDVPVVRTTVYRMNAFQALADHGLWSLDLPLVVRGKEISLTTLFAPPSDCFDGPELGSRALAVTTPLARGADVRLLQLGLSDAGIQVTADGVYGNGSAAAVRQYEAAHGLASSSVADKDLIMKIAQPG